MADNPTESSSTGGARLKVRRTGQQQGQDGQAERSQLHTERLVSNRPLEAERKLSFPVRGFQTDQASTSSCPEESSEKMAEAVAVEMNPIDEVENDNSSDEDDGDVSPNLNNNLPPVMIKGTI